ncbi:olfactory receptor 10A6-like [Boleophthalmus pectinirostris]|uniref:olfactory receptor 10A6-like n=1 Tax=Boleophthalmus pectinirostris TaxID=150288 RepID=UPI002432DCFC|nr:olfactory receptor 10A6-like [Boleophthalmus pectinirostris]
MKNVTQNPAFFQLTLFSDYGRLRYLFFSLSLVIYMTIISANMVIIATILIERSLHQPMYVFICCLSVNSLYGSAGFFPRFLVDLLSGSHFISRTSCFIQIHVIYTYVSCEFTILGVMAYDRFVAICQPLHYHTKMTIRKALFLWGVAVAYPVVTVTYSLVLTTLLPLCGNQLHRIFCANRAVVHLSCGDTTHSVIVGYLIFFTTIFVPLFYILSSYMRILIVCKRGSAELRGKALQTCLPHLVTFVVYSCSVFIEMSISQFNTGQINPIVTAIISLEYLIVPSINNPLIYGLKLPKIRAAISQRFKMKTKIILATHPR